MTSADDVVISQNLDADDDVWKSGIKHGIVQDEAGRTDLRVDERKVEEVVVAAQLAGVGRQLPRDVKPRVEDRVESGLVIGVRFIARPEAITQERDQKRAVVALALVAVHDNLLPIRTQPLCVDVEADDGGHRLPEVEIGDNLKRLLVLEAVVVRDLGSIL